MFPIGIGGCTEAARAVAASRIGRRVLAAEREPNALILVRHGPARPDPDSPPHEWPLLDREAGAVLACLLPPVPVVCSDERKAVETAEAMGRTFSIDGRLREVSRPWIGDRDDFGSAVRRYLGGEVLPGWEPQSEALARFTEAAEGIVVSHGTVMSLFVASQVKVDPIAFWSDLTMPDAWELKDGQVVRLL